MSYTSWRVAARGRRLALLSAMVAASLSAAPATAQLCATPGKDGGATNVPAAISGGASTYYPSQCSASAGATSIPVGTPVGGPAITAGDLLLVIQMQGATINSSNSISYGNGSTGSGSTSRTAGTFEFVVAQGPVSSGSVPILGAGGGGGLVNSYSHFPTTLPRRVFQVVRVPQYYSARLTGTVTATPWNGTLGGIVALDVRFFLDLDGQTISVDGQGFRGGGGRSLGGGSGHSNTDYVRASTVPFHASKGEGFAGTPRYVFDGTSLVDRGGARDDYPGGGYARGAPGNAGGGGNDWVSANSNNSGGGGGGNGGAGGRGGNSWSSNQPVGGLGGAGLAPSSSVLLLGGGGGAGTSNNAGPGHGARGGGIIFLRADQIIDTGILSANGSIAPDSSQDGSGGGGAGGTINVGSCLAGAMAGVTARANGGRGGNAVWTAGDFHGPGGGGGGGNILSTGAIATSVTGGANGVATTATAYNAQPGSAGGTATSIAVASVGARPGCLCSPVAAEVAALRSYPSPDGFGREVAWSTSAEIDSAGFQLFRSTGDDWVEVGDFQPAAHAPGGWYRVADPGIEAGEQADYVLREIELGGSEKLHGVFGSDGFDESPGEELERLLPASASRFHAGAADAALRSETANAQRPQGSLAVEVVGEGLVVLGEAQLSEHLGVSGPELHRLLRSGNLSVRNGVRQVPWARLGSLETGSGAATDGLAFWVQGPTRASSASRVYVVSLGPGVIMQRRVASTGGTAQTQVQATVRQEADLFPALVLGLDGEDDFWFSHALLGGGPARTLSVDVPALAGSAALLQVDLHGATAGDGVGFHRVQVALNGAPVGLASFAGVAAHSLRLRIDGAALQDGINQVTLQALAPAAGGTSVAYVDGVEVTYPRRTTAVAGRLDVSWNRHATLLLEDLPPRPLTLDLSDPSAPVLVDLTLEPGASGLEATVQGRRGQRLVLLPEASTTAPLHPLLGLRASRGGLGASLTAAGSPVASSDLAGLRGVEYLVVAGDDELAAASEPLLELRQRDGLVARVVTFDDLVDSGASERSADALSLLLERLTARGRLRYVLLLGNAHYDVRNRLSHGELDRVPSPLVGRHDGTYASDATLASPGVSLGRIAARTPAEASAAIDKILSWERSGGFAREPSYSFLVDDADGAGDFPADAASLAMLASASGPSQIVQHAGDLAATRAEAQRLFAVQGSLLTYLGHGATGQLMSEGAVTVQDLLGDWLPQNEVPPVLAALTCIAGRFEVPASSSIADQAVLSAGGGAIAALAAGGTTQHRSSVLLAEALIESLASSRHERLGDLLLAARARYLSSGADPRDLETVHLFGDPALRLSD